MPPRGKPVQRADTIDLEGPSEPTLVPPPNRRGGVTTVFAIGVFAVLVLTGVLLVRPELIAVVQAFSLGLRP